MKINASGQILNTKANRDAVLSVCLSVLLLALISAPAQAASQSVSDGTHDWILYSNPDGNTIDISGTAVVNSGVAGSYAENSGNNAVNISGGTINANVFGGWATTGSAYGNSVTWTGGSISGNVLGAYTANAGAVSGNSVLVNGIVTHSASIIGARGNGLVTNNSVILQAGAVSSLLGGESGNGGDCTENHVTVSGGSATVVMGGYAGSDAGDASNNRVTVSAGTVSTGTIPEQGGIYGGYATGDGKNANGNSVEISGGTTPYEIAGGWSASDAAGEATGNTVTISGNPVMTATAYVFGGVSYSNNDSFTGNTLNKNSGVALATIMSFEDVNFGYDGEANISTLDTTPQGSSSAAVNLNTGGHGIDFDGDITGTGGITKQGSGELALSGTNSNYAGDTTVSSGTLNITGSLSIESWQTLTVESGAALKITGSQGLSIASGGTLLNYGTITGAGLLDNAGGSTVNNYGTIDASVNINDPSSVSTASTVPQNFTALPGNGSASLSWDAPTHFGGGSSISQYQVTNDNWATTANVTSGTSRTFSGLSNGTQYTFKVRAVNDNGTVLAEASATATPVAPSGGGGSGGGGGDEENGADNDEENGTGDDEESGTGDGEGNSGSDTGGGCNTVSGGLLALAGIAWRMLKNRGAKKQKI